MVVLGLRFCVRAFSSCGKWGPLFIVVRGPLIIVASLVAEHRLQTRRVSNYGSRAQLLRGMWDLPRPGLEPVSPALAGRLSTTEPPGKPSTFMGRFLIRYFSSFNGCQSILVFNFFLKLSCSIIYLLGICPFLVSFQIYWHKVIHSIRVSFKSMLYLYFVPLLTSNIIYILSPPFFFFPESIYFISLFKTSHISQGFCREK